MSDSALQPLYVDILNLACRLPESLGVYVPPRDLLASLTPVLDLTPALPPDMVELRATRDWPGDRPLAALQRKRKAIAKALGVPVNPLELYDVAIRLPLALSVHAGDPEGAIAAGLGPVLGGLSREAIEAYLAQAFSDDAAYGRSDTLQALEVIYWSGSPDLRRRLSQAWVHLLGSADASAPDPQIVCPALTLLSSLSLSPDIREAAQIQVRRLVLLPASLRVPQVSQCAVRAALALGLQNEDGVRAGLQSYLGDPHCGLMICEALAAESGQQAVRCFEVLLSSWAKQTIDDATVRQLADALRSGDAQWGGGWVISYLKEQADQHASVGDHGFQHLLNRALAL